jgi:serine/threonine-protein kinase
MTAAAPTSVYEFGPFRVDPAERLLLKDAEPVALTPKAFDLLVHLLERHGHLVEKQALMAALWPDAVVEEANLAYNVSAVRKALGDGQEGEQFIQTVPTRGYRFVAPVRELSREPARTSMGLLGLGLRPLGAALAIGALIGGLVTWRTVRPEGVPAVVRFELPTVTDRLQLGAPAVSPDGGRIAYVAAGSEGSQLHLRPLDSIEAMPLRGTGGARQPFFSPDGKAVGFFAGERLMKVDLATGRVTRLCAAKRISRGAAWGPDDRVYFSPGQYSGLWVVSANGGQPQALTRLTPDEVAHGWPELLPGGRHLVFSRWDSEVLDDARIEALSLESGERRTILEGGFGGRYVPTGHLLYGRGRSLMAVSFDPGTLRVSGTAARVIEGMAVARYNGTALFGVSRGGTLAYFPGGKVTGGRRMLWIAPSGSKTEALGASPGSYIDPRLSADGLRLAVAPAYGTQQDIWVSDLAHGTWTRLTVNPRNDVAPVWRPDDPSAILFSMGRGGAYAEDLFSVPADASRAPELVYESPYEKYATSAAQTAPLAGC